MSATSVPRHCIARSRRPLRSTILALTLAALGLACQSQNSSDTGSAAVMAIPQASFSEDATSGAPGLTVRFNDSSTGEVERYEWNFGPLGTRSDRDPVVTFSEAGVYSAELTVFGGNGSSTMRKASLIVIEEPPVAGASCTPTEGYLPLTVVCRDESTDASGFYWNFGDGTDSGETNPTHTFTSPGSYTIQHRAQSAGGSDTVTVPVEVYTLGIVATPPSGSLPGNVVLSIDSGGRTGIAIWMIDGQMAGSSNPLLTRFAETGTYTIELTFGQLGSPVVGTASLDYVVDYGPATAAFAPDVSDGSGPLEVVFNDESTGAVTQWEWDFGDGEHCLFPAPAEPDPSDPEPVCNASSPSHTYAAIGSYDVTLTVSGPDVDPGASPIESTAVVNDAVRVYIMDPSFEAQAANGAIGGAWTALRPDPVLVAADHLALAVGGGADAGMPSHGSKWAVLEGLGTDGSADVDAVENGIRQEFILPIGLPVLEFDYALLYAEPPASPIMDAFTATVSDGTRTVEIAGARANVASPYAGESNRFATRDGSLVRATPRRTASLDVSAAFPTANADTRFTLTLRVTNASNGFRSPLAYVDDIRFGEPATALAARFALEGDPIVAGEEAVFVDETCPDPNSGACAAPTSWRWDFDTQGLPAPPSASGSGEQDPSYVFPEPGVYEVRQLVRLADLESEATLSVTVIDGPTADFELLSVEPPSPPRRFILTFADLSSEDPADPIVGYSWDFAGWGVSSLESPDPVQFVQAGDSIVRLTVTTASGQTDTAEMTVTLE